MSINPATGEPWGSDFPIVTVEDWVDAQARLADRLGIERFAAVMGGSLGGMQALCWATRYPERIAQRAGDRGRAQPLGAEHRLQRGRARGDPRPIPNSTTATTTRIGVKPVRGLRVARMIGHITYISDEQMGGEVRPAAAATGSTYSFGPSSRSNPTCVTRARSSPSTSTPTPTCASPRRSTIYDPGARDRAAISPARSRPRRCRFLVISFTTDWRFSPARAREIVKALVDNRHDLSRTREIVAPHGHDAFLLDTPQYHAVVALVSVRFDRPGAEAPAVDEQQIEPGGIRRACGFRDDRRLDRVGRARARSGLRRRQPARVPARLARSDGLRHRDRR